MLCYVLAKLFHIKTLPVPRPIPIMFPDTAEHDGRYSDGNHTTLLELCVIHVLSELKAKPWYLGFSGSITPLKTSGAALIVIVPISV